MKFNAFENLSLDSQPEAPASVEGEKPVLEQKDEAKDVGKVDRRMKITPKAPEVAGPGDVELSGDALYGAKEDAYRELRTDGKGNRNPSPAELKKRMTQGVFMNMPEEEVADRIVDALVADPVARNEIVTKTNTSLKTDFVINQAKLQKEEQDRKWEEVDRVESLKEAERKETARRTAQVLKEREDELRKWEEVDRVRSIKDYALMSFEDLEKDPDGYPILQQKALEFLTTIDKAWFNENYTGEITPEGYLVARDGTKNTTPLQNIGGGNSLQWVIDATKTELLRGAPESELKRIKMPKLFADFEKLYADMEGREPAEYVAKLQALSKDVQDPLLKKYLQRTAQTLLQGERYKNMNAVGQSIIDAFLQRGKDFGMRM